MNPPKGHKPLKGDEPPKGEILRVKSWGKNPGDEWGGTPGELCQGGTPPG